MDWYTVWLREDYPEWEGAEWFPSDIEGTHDYCVSQIRIASLDQHYFVRVVSNDE
jgi:hypothetical protein